MILLDTNHGFTSFRRMPRRAAGPPGDMMGGMCDSVWLGRQSPVCHPPPLETQLPVRYWLCYLLLRSPNITPLEIMDHSLHPHDDQELASMPTPTRGAKRSRENETPSQRHKREKAAERQRRKRERDRQAASAGNATGASPQELMTYPPPAIMDVEQHSQMLHHAHPPPPPQHVEYADPAGLRTVDSNPGEHDMTADEVQRRERVRAAARERQRKHRALVKARKMRELGLDMGNEVMGTVEDLSYRVDPEGAYTPVLVPQHEPTAPPPPHPHPHIPQPQPQHQQEPAFPQNQPLGGQTFASTLLLSFSCAPLLKQHLLRTLSMTNDELASLEPVIAQAWDQWDHDVRI